VLAGGPGPEHHVNDRKTPRPMTVQVLRRPTATPPDTPTSGPAPRPAPRPTGAAVPRPSPSRLVSPTPRAGVAPAPRPAVAPAPRTSELPAPRPGPRSAEAPRFSSRPPPRRGPPTQEEVEALARRERVPARIARGELEGKMKCRIWRKLHAEEAQNFARVYELMEKHPGLSLADGFGMLQSGLSFEEFQARRARAQRKQQVKQARQRFDNTPVAEFLAGLREAQTPLCVVLGERTLLDTLADEAPTAFTLGANGHLEKLQVVALARAETWEPLLPKLQRDPRLAQKPAPVARQPVRRPFSDPHLFEPHVGTQLQLGLRNGLSLRDTLLAVGGFDLLLGAPGREILVPLHALLSWQVADADPE